MNITLNQITWLLYYASVIIINNSKPTVYVTMAKHIIHNAFWSNT